MTKETQEILSKEMIVGLEIFKSQQENEIIYFSKLVDKLKGRISRNTISKSLDKLFDLGMANAKWSKSNGNWIREVVISGESEKFFKDLYDEVNY